MKHLRHVTVAKAEAKQDDVAGAVFLQLWLTTFMFMLTAAFSEK